MLNGSRAPQVLDRNYKVVNHTPVHVGCGFTRLARSRVKNVTRILATTSTSTASQHVFRSAPKPNRFNMSVVLKDVGDVLRCYSTAKIVNDDFTKFGTRAAATARRV